MLYLYILIGIFGLASVTTLIVSWIIEAKKSRISKEIMRPDVLMDYEKRLGKFLESNQISRREGLMQLCQKLNAQIETVPSIDRHLNGAEAVIDYSENGYVVHVAENLGLKQRRFAIAHEIGHVVMGDKLPVKRNGHGIFIRSKDEQIRDYIAAAILLPRDKFSQLLAEKQFYSLGTKGKNEFIATVSEEFDVDESVVIKRIKECKLLAEIPS